MRFLILLFATTLAAACADNDFSAMKAPSASLADYHVGEIAIAFAPDATLEWCEDDLWQCDMVEFRIMQTFEAGATIGAASLRGAKPARLEITVDRFDSITLASRMTTGGVHDIDATFRLIDSRTGAGLTGGDPLDFDRVAWGRTAALIANLSGRTQRVRIAERIADVTRSWIAALTGASA